MTAGFAVERQWSDQSGSHQISGRLQFADATSVQLLTTAGKTFQIAIAQLSEADRVFVQTFLTAEKAAAAGGAKSPFEVVEESPFEVVQDASFQPAALVAPVPQATSVPESPAGPVAIKDVKAAKITAGAARLSMWKTDKEFWRAKPPAAYAFCGSDDIATASSFKPIRERVVAVGGGSPRAFATTYEVWSGKGDTKLAVFDYATAAPVTETEYPIPLKALAVSPNGKLAIALKDQGFGRGEDLYLFDIRGDSLRPIYKFEAGNGERDQVVSAYFLSNGRLLTVTYWEQVSVWDLSSDSVARSPLGKRVGKTIEFSAAGDQLAMIDGPAIGIVDTTIMRQVGCIIPPTTPLSVAFAADGQSIAVQSSAVLHFYSTATGKLLKSIPTAEQSAEKLKHFGDYVLVGSRLYAAKSGVPVWRFKLGENSAAVGNLLVAATEQRGQFGVTFAAIPDASIAGKLSGVDAESLYVLKPGMSVAIDVTAADNQHVTADAIRGGLTKTAEKNGWVVDASASIRFTATLEQLPSAEFEYEITEGDPYHPSPFRRGRSTGEAGKVTYTPWSSKVKLLDGEKTLWETARWDGMRDGVGLKEGESVQVAAERVSRPHLDFFESATPPPHVISPELIDGFGETSLK